MSKVIITSQKLVNLADAVRTHNSISDKLKLPDIPGMLERDYYSLFAGRFDLADGIVVYGDSTMLEVGFKSKSYVRIRTTFDENRYPHIHPDISMPIKVYSGNGTLLHDETQRGFDWGSIGDGPVNWDVYKNIVKADDSGETKLNKYDFEAEVLPDSEGYYVYTYSLYPAYVKTLNLLYYGGKYLYDTGIKSSDIDRITEQLRGGYVVFTDKRS